MNRDLRGKTTACIICGAPVPAPGRKGGRPRITCSEGCSQERNRRLTRTRPPRDWKYDVPAPTVRTERCPDCGERKPAADFNRDRGAATGLQAHCRACEAQRRRQPRQKARHQQACRAWWRRQLKENRRKARERSFAVYWQAKGALDPALRAAGEALREATRPIGEEVGA